MGGPNHLWKSSCRLNITSTILSPPFESKNKDLWCVLTTKRCHLFPEDTVLNQWKYLGILKCIPFVFVCAFVKGFTQFLHSVTTRWRHLHLWCWHCWLYVCKRSPVRADVLCFYLSPYRHNTLLYLFPPSILMTHGSGRCTVMTAKWESL